MTKEAKGTLYLRKDEIENVCKSLGIIGLSPSDNREASKLMLTESEKF